jgi:glycosyltransferase involved in cell wall biosynthesis
MTAPPRILHLHSTFEAGDQERRCVRLINAIGRSIDHAIVSDDLDRRSAAAGLDPRLRVAWPKFPPLSGAPLPGRLKRLAAAMAGYDLICTYKSGALNAAFAHTLFADVFKLAPLVHHEDGSDEQGAGGPRASRNFYRRIALGRCAAIVVSSRTLERTALETWVQPRSKVRLIPSGIDTAAYGRRQKRTALPRLVKQKGELWIGTLAGLRKAEDLSALVRAVRDLPDTWQLVIAGEGPERGAILAEAESCGIEHRVHLPGSVDPARAIGLFDIFALSPRSKPLPIPVAEAMAGGLPIAAPRVGDVAAMVASENGPYLSQPGDETALARAIAQLAAYPALRERIGEANRAKARAEYDEDRMIARYRALYCGLIDHR